MSDILIEVFGWRAGVFHGDPSVYDRWRWLKRHLRPGAYRTLDAGCGSGVFAFYAANRGNCVVGLSFDVTNHAKALRRARILGTSNAEFHVVDLRRLDEWRDRLGRFDQVLCFETIEHIRDDTKLVRDLCALLAPGGRILLTTPYKHYVPLLGDRVSLEEDGGHVRPGYTHEEIRAMLSVNGVQVVVEEFISGAVSQYLINVLRLLARVEYHAAWLATFPLRLFQVIDHPLTRGIGYPFLSIGIVGVKP